MKRILTAMLTVIISGSAAFARRYSDAEMQAMFLKRPPPDYPHQARLRHITGSGVFRLFVDEQGKVTAIKVLESAGAPELDKSAMFALVHWVARPGPKREVDVPITFSVGGR